MFKRGFTTVCAVNFVAVPGRECLGQLTAGRRVLDYEDTGQGVTGLSAFFSLPPGR